MRFSDRKQAIRVSVVHGVFCETCRVVLLFARLGESNAREGRASDDKVVLVEEAATSK